jgi:hypothetical protein
MSIESQNSSGNSNTPNPIELPREESERETGDTTQPLLQHQDSLLTDRSLNIKNNNDDNKNKYNGIFVVSHRIDNRRNTNNTNNGENNNNDSAYYNSETNIANFGVIVQIKKG